MTTKTGLDLTALDKILLHLRDNWHRRNDRVFPPSVTQKGISEATGLRLSHVPRSLKALAGRELVHDVKGHVEGEKRRYKSYFLTDKGLAEANALVEHLKTQTADYKGAETLVSEILAREKSGQILPVILRLVGQEAAPKKVSRKIVGDVPPIDGFVNRQAELESMGGMLDDDALKLIVIYGSRGYGTSSLAAKFLHENSGNWSSAWVPMRRSFTEFGEELKKSLGLLVPDLKLEPDRPGELASQLEGKGIILALDNYFEASDELVEYLSGLVAAIKHVGGFKLLVTARENTPSYNRFYTILDIHDGTVGEVHIRGLDIEHCQELLGSPDIDPEAMKRLYMFTMGKPPTLKLLAEGDAEAIRAGTRFSPEEIKLMLYLKGQRISE